LRGRDQEGDQRAARVHRGPTPSKIIEARDKPNDGDSTASSGIRQINQRREVYGLEAVKAA
jgi:hypothetical protein